MWRCCRGSRVSKTSVQKNEDVSRRQSSFHRVPSHAFHAFFLAVCSALTSTRLTTTTPAGWRAAQQGSLRTVQSSSVLLEEPRNVFSDQCVPCSTGTFVLENTSKSSMKTFVFFVSNHVNRSELLLLATFCFTRLSFVFYWREMGRA